MGAAAGPATRSPMLVVHDAAPVRRYAALLDFLTAATADGRLPPMRAALLAPVDRNEHYSASPAWSRTLVSGSCPPSRLTPTPPGRRWLVGMGASLGALATLAARPYRPGQLRRPVPAVGQLLPARRRRHERDHLPGSLGSPASSTTWPPAAARRAGPVRP